jgi:hypothetical protein
MAKLRIFCCDVNKDWRVAVFAVFEMGYWIHLFPQIDGKEQREHTKNIN